LNWEAVLSDYAQKLRAVEIYDKRFDDLREDVRKIYLITKDPKVREMAHRMLSELQTP
jgi:hypothetical protein